MAAIILGGEHFYKSGNEKWTGPRQAQLGGPGRWAGGLAGL